MGRADTLRAQLAAVEEEESALATYRQVRDAYRDDPDPATRAAVEAAALIVRETRARLRADRGVDAMIFPDAVATRSTIGEV